MLKLSGAIGYFIKLASISIKCTVICKSLNRPLIIKTISVLLCIFVVVVALWGRLRERAKSYAKALANDILR